MARNLREKGMTGNVGAPRNGTLRNECALPSANRYA